MRHKFFAQNLQKSYKTKREHHHRVLHIQITLGTRFQHKLTILKIWTKLNQKMVFLIYKRKKRSPLNFTY